MSTPRDLTGVFAYVDSQRSEMLALLVDYLMRPSISAHGEGIAETAEHVAGILRGIGLETRVIQTDGWPMVFGEMAGPAGSPTVLLYGHYDVQPPDPLDEWISPPFEPTIRNGRLYARGVGDNKGQHLAQILGVKSLLETHGSLPCNVKVLLEGEEEIGSPQMPAFARAYRDLLAADLIITSDGPVDDSGRSRIVFGVRGGINFTLRARGANQDLHSGNWGGVAPNPIWTLVHLLSTMKDAQGRVLIDGFYDNVLPLTEAEQRALDALPVDADAVKARLGLEQFDQPLDRGYHERLSAWPTFTINGFHGGYGGPRSKSVVPHEAFVKCDMRIVEAQTADEVFEKVVKHVRREAPGVEVIRHGSMDPSKTPLDSPFAEPIRQGIVAAQGEEPLFLPTLGASLPDYVFTKVLGIPAFNVPYANPDESNHAPNENMEVERFYMGVKTGAAMLEHLGAMTRKAE
jgi:acetylornithine deacetylase/succinyl-diaminopimelate desuccinylase-like protein